MNAYCATTSLSSRHVTRLYRSVHPSERVSEIRFVGKIAWMCVRETRLIVSLIQDTACCDQSTEASEADCQVSQLTTPAISHKPWSEVYRYHKLHAAVASCLWDLYRACNAHPWESTVSEIQSIKDTELKLPVLSIVDVFSNCMPARMSTSPLAQNLFVVTLEKRIYCLSRQLTWFCKCDLWNCWSLQNC